MSLQVVSDLLQEQLTDIVTLIGRPQAERSSRQPQAAADLVDTLVGPSPKQSTSALPLSLTFELEFLREYSTRARLMLHEEECRAQALCELYTT
jgi:hypothetical protein